MAKHTDLPIYRDTYQFLKLISELVPHMRRDFKRSYGDKLLDETIAICLFISKANAARDKAPYIDRLLERLEAIEIIIRIGRDMQIISTKGYAKATLLTGSIGRQAGGWRKRPTSAS